MSIKVVSFDLDDTLWPIHPVIIKAEKETNKWLVANYPGVKKILYSEDMIDIRNQLINNQRDLLNNLSELRKLCLVELGIRSGYKKIEAKNMAKESFKIFFSKRNCVNFYDGVEDCLIQLKKKYLLGVITNGNANLKEIGINHYFDFYVSAEDINCGKPDPKIFHTFIKKTGLHANEICHVGDHALNDVSASLNVGMKAIWFNEKKDNWPFEEILDFEEIYYWKELEQVLEKINSKHQA